MGELTFYSHLIDTSCETKTLRCVGVSGRCDKTRRLVLLQPCDCPREPTGLGQDLSAWCVSFLVKLSIAYETVRCMGRTECLEDATRLNVWYCLPNVALYGQDFYQTLRFVDRMLTKHCNLWTECLPNGAVCGQDGVSGGRARARGRLLA